MEYRLELELLADDTATPLDFAPRRFIVAGWTGRDHAAMAHHMDELEAIGIKRPTSTPVFYRNSVTRLVTVDSIQTPGPGSSGEVEYVLFNIDGEVWVGVGSDHTDRDVEAYNITVSKQMCDKPVARQLWRYDALRSIWDELKVESHAVIEGEKVLYQQGTLAKMLSAEDLLAALRSQTGTDFGPGDVMMGGTLPAIGGVRASSHFAFSLEDPRNGARIQGAYDVHVLDNVG